MKLTPIIMALRERCPSFAGRVGGAADYADLNQKANMDVPAAYVVPLEDSPEKVRGTDNEYRQVIEDNFGVVVILSNVADRRGQAAYDQVHQIRAELWRALLGWEPSDDYGPIEYRGGDLLGQDRALMVWKFDFMAETELTEVETYHGAELAALPAMATVRIEIDMIDPAADPNATPDYPGGYPGPDGRIEGGADIILPTD